MIKFSLPQEQKKRLLKTVVNLLVLILAMFLCTAIFTLKYYLYRGHSYTSDMFGLTNASKSWLLGYPLFYDLHWGADYWHHNHFTILALAPLLLKFGGAGFILSLFLLYSYSILKVFKLFSEKIFFGIFIFGTYLGPIAFWIIDDPVYGFHAEVLYPPLLVLLICSLITKDLVESIIWSIAILLNREDGPILIAGSGLLLSWAFREKIYKFSGRSYQANALRIIALGVLVFFLHMLILKIYGSSGRALIGMAFQKLPQIWENESTLYDLFEVSRKTCLLILTTLFVTVPLLFHRTFKELLLAGLVFLLGLSPILLVTVIASFANIENVAKLGMNWVPRYALIHAYLIAGIIIILHTSTVRSYKLFFSYFAASWFLQFSALPHNAVFGYNVFERIKFAYYGKKDRRFSVREIKTIRCLASTFTKNDQIIGLPPTLESEFDHNFTVGTIKSVELDLNADLLLCDSDTSRSASSDDCLAALNEFANSEYYDFKVGRLTGKLKNSNLVSSSCLKKDR